jgi:hypothetical protein
MKRGGDSENSPMERLPSPGRSAPGAPISPLSIPWLNV